jgi:hypothetical protein
MWTTRPTRGGPWCPTPGRCGGQPLVFVRLGLTGFNFIPTGPDAEDQVQRLAHEIIPTIRARV